mmetsp:Transcript_6783/g.15494  ORF Transcript_6783/g.15494 Transcript_6783/m.15494 type:complete len:276 (+) Transcript_6783:1395-2222(+)
MQTFPSSDGGNPKNDGNEEDEEQSHQHVADGLASCLGLLGAFRHQVLPDDISWRGRKGHLDLLSVGQSEQPHNDPRISSCVEGDEGTPQVQVVCSINFLFECFDLLLSCHLASQQSGLGCSAYRLQHSIPFAARTCDVEHFVGTSEALKCILKVAGILHNVDVLHHLLAKDLLVEIPLQAFVGVLVLRHFLNQHCRRTGSRHLDKPFCSVLHEDLLLACNAPLGGHHNIPDSSCVQPAQPRASCYIRHIEGTKLILSRRISAEEVVQGTQDEDLG